jgi:VanZ family protein
MCIRINKMKKKRIITLILIIAWMLLVYFLSNQVAEDSANLSQGFLKTILKLLNLKGETLFITEHVIRKLAHLALYTLGGILIYTHVKTYNLEENSKVMISQIIGMTYAITDEIHQAFVPGRSGEVRDVLIDSLGIAIGMLIIAIIYTIKKKKEGK